MRFFCAMGSETITNIMPVQTGYGAAIERNLVWELEELARQPVFEERVEYHLEGYVPILLKLVEKHQSEEVLAAKTLRRGTLQILLGEVFCYGRWSIDNLPKEVVHAALARHLESSRRSLTRRRRFTRGFGTPSNPAETLLSDMSFHLMQGEHDKVLYRLTRNTGGTPLFRCLTAVWASFLNGRRLSR